MAQRMGLPHSLYTSPPTSTSPDTTFPRLKIKVIPRISLSTNLAPEKPKPKALEETIRIVAPLGAKIALSWSVKTAVLEDVDPLPEGGQHAFEDCIGSWILTVGCPTLPIAEIRTSSNWALPMPNGRWTRTAREEQHRWFSAPSPRRHPIRL